MILQCWYIKWIYVTVLTYHDVGMLVAEFN